MSATRLDEIAIRALVPRDDPVGATAAALLGRACGDPLIGALDTAAEPLRIMDPDAYWVIRTLQVHVAVPVSEDDPAAQAQRIASAVVAAIERLVRRGPDADAVRFSSRADYGAAFVRALMAGAADSWVYQRLATLRRMRPAVALLAVAQTLDVDLLAVFGAFVIGGAVPRLLLSAAEVELAGLDSALCAAAGAAPAVPRRLIAAAREIAGTTPRDGAQPAFSRPVRRLDLLSRLIPAFGATPQVVAAVWIAVPDPTTGTPNRSSGLDAGSVDSTLAAETGDDEPDRARPWMLAAPGAVGFLLLPDLDGLIPPDSVLSRSTPPAAGIRAAVLAVVLGDAVPADDPALALAAGVDPRAETDPDAQESLLQRLLPWAEDLRADPMLGWSHARDGDWFSAAPPILAVIANALLRRFAAHLMGFGQASAAYLAERVMPPGGVVVRDGGAISVELPPVPLQIVLTMAGLDTFAATPRWLDCAVTVTHGGLR